MGGRQVVRPRTLDPVSKVRILPAQPAFQQSIGRKVQSGELFRWRRSITSGATRFNEHQTGQAAPLKAGIRYVYASCENWGEGIVSGP